MRPRIGAITGRFRSLLPFMLCVLVCTRVAMADELATGDAAAPGPRPAAIAPPEVDEPADESLPESAALQSGEASAVGDASQDANSQAGDQEPAAGSPEIDLEEQSSEFTELDAARSLGLPASVERESQLIARDDAVEPASWGWLDPRTNEVTRVIGALAVVIGMILLLRAAVRRLGGPLLDGGRPSGVLLVLARYPVARGQHLVLLKLGRRLLLCHQAKGAMATLCEIENEDEVAAMLARIESGSRGRDAARFEKMLEDFNQEHRRRAYTAHSEATDMRRAMAAAPVVDLTRRNASGNGGAAGWLRLRKAAS